MHHDRAQLVPANAETIARGADILRRGGLVAFPTETVYGLGVHALDREAVRRLFAAKGRPATDPLIVHVASLDAAAPLLRRIPDEARRLAARFWPGPLTLVMPRSALVPDEVTAGLDTVAIRVPVHPVARALLETAAIPIAAPSANLFSRPSPTQASHVMDDLAASIDLVIDGGPTTVGIESTVLDLCASPPAILRPGAVTPDLLRDVVVSTRKPTSAEAPVGKADADAPLRSPGLLERHYSPRAPLTLYEGRDALEALARDARAAADAGQQVAVVIGDEDWMRLAEELVAVRVVQLGSSEDPAAVAARLYAVLRELDAAGIDLILVHAFVPAEGLGVAIRDRLRRAAAGRIVS